MHKITLLLALVFAAQSASASFLKPEYYADQCAELAFEIAYDNQIFVKDEFEYFAPAIVEYENSNVVVDQSIILEQDRRFMWNKDHEVICGFNRDGGIIDYQNPFDDDNVYELDEPVTYIIEPGDYVDVKHEDCTIIDFSTDVALKIAGGAAVGAVLGITGGIVAIPVAGGVLVFSGSGGAAILTATVSGLVGGAKSGYHCVAK
jgi:hypothetical protein